MDNVVTIDDLTICIPVKERQLNIPKFAPKEYQFKEIVNQADDIADFEKVWHPGLSRINNELYSLVEENSPPKNSSNSKKVAPVAANGVRQDK